MRPSCHRFHDRYQERIASWLVVSVAIYFYFITSVIASAVPVSGLPKGSFFSQTRAANELYFKRKITDPLTALRTIEHDINGKVAMWASNSPGITFSNCLDYGDAVQPRIFEEVVRLLRFQLDHNSKLDQWRGNKEAAIQFYEALKLHNEQVLTIRRSDYHEAWPYVSIHWHRAVHEMLGQRFSDQGDLVRSIHDELSKTQIIGSEAPGLPSGFPAQRWLFTNPLPKEGLLLSPEDWNAPEVSWVVQRYALLSLLRCECRMAENQVAQQFVTEQIGATGLASNDLHRVTFKRFTHLYYEYDHIASAPFNAPSGSLAPFLVRVSAWRSESRTNLLLAEFYRRKLGLFSDLVIEMGRPDSIRESAAPYLPFYDFLCRTIPCVSAFAPTSAVNGSADAGILFTESFPAAQESGAVTAFDEPSFGIFPTQSPVAQVVRLCQKLGQDSGPGTLYSQLIEPIVLIPLRLRESLNSDFPYEDLKVGYTGYLDWLTDIETKVDTSASLKTHVNE